MITLASQVGIAVPAGMFEVYGDWPTPNVALAQAGSPFTQSYMTNTANVYFTGWESYLLHYGIHDPTRRSTAGPNRQLNCVQAWSQAQLQTLTTGGAAVGAVGAAILINSSTIGLALGLAGATVATGGGALLLVGLLFLAWGLGGTIVNMGEGNLCP